MSKVDDVFRTLRNEGKKAFMPFITAGDPNLETTGRLIGQFDEIGCHLCEVGIPYSDPIADGPVIQASYTRALAQGTSLINIMEMLAATAPPLKMPVITMVSYAIVYRWGLKRYVETAKQAGVSGAIVPDLLIEEADEFAEICRQADFSLIQLVTPTTPRERAVRIAESTTGFIYYVSVTGITGERTVLPAELADNVAWLREQTDLPICIGFGISKPEHIELLKPVCDGMIVGSAIVKRMTERSNDKILSDVRDYASELLSAVS